MIINKTINLVLFFMFKIKLHEIVRLTIIYIHVFLIIFLNITFIFGYNEIINHFQVVIIRNFLVNSPPHNNCSYIYLFEIKLHR